MLDYEPVATSAKCTCYVGTAWGAKYRTTVNCELAATEPDNL